MATGNTKITFDDLRRKASERAKQEEEQKDQGISFDDLRKKAYEEEQKRNEIKQQDYRYVSSAMDSIRSHIEKSSNAYDGMSYDGYAKIVSDELKRGTDLGSTISSLDNYLKQNGSRMGEDYVKQVQEYLNLARTDMNSLMDAYRSARDMYGQFSSEDEYNAAVKEYDMLQEYGDLSYSQIKDKLFILPQDSEDRQWLEQYAPTTMTAKDYDNEIAPVAALVQLYDDIVVGKSVIMDGRVFNNTGDASRYFVKKYGDPDELKEKLNQLEEGRWYQQNKEKFQAYTEEEGYAGFSQDYLAPFGYQDVMTQDEVKLYSYLKDKDEDLAREYMDYMKITLDERIAESTKTGAYQFGYEHPLLAAVPRTAAGTISGLGYLDVAGQKLTKDITEFFTGEYSGPVNYNSSLNLPSIYAEAAASGGSESLSDRYGRIEINEEEHPLLSKVFSAINGKGVGDLYQIGLSVVDSSIAAAMGPVAGAAMLSGGAATSGMREAVARGANDSQALLMGLFNGVNEMLFEEFSLEKLLSADTSNIILAMLKQGGIEASEEALTSLANNYADVLIMAEKSGYSMKIQQYIDQGYSESDARSKAMADVAAEIGWDAIAGFLSGTVTGGGHAVIDKLTKNQSTAQQGKDTDFASFAGMYKQTNPTANDQEVETAYQVYQEFKAIEAEMRSAIPAESTDAGQETSPAVQTQEAPAAVQMQEAVLAGQEAPQAAEASDAGTVPSWKTAEDEEAAGETVSKAFADNYRKLYNAGFSYSSVEGIAEKITNMTVEQKISAWDAGKKARDAALSPDSKTAIVRYNGGIVETPEALNFGMENKEAYETLNNFAKAWGVKVYIGNYAAGYNGKISSGVLRIDATKLSKMDKKAAMATIFAHEITHRMQETDAQSYIKYRDFALQALSESVDLEALIDSYKKQTHEEIERQKAEGKMPDIQELTDEAAMDEIAADFTQQFILNTKLFEDFISRSEEHRSLGKMVLDFFKNLLADIKRRISGKGAQNAAALQESGFDIGTLEKAVKLWEAAWDAGTSAVSKAEITLENAPEIVSGDTKYSIAMNEDLHNSAVAMNQKTGNVPETILSKAMKDMQKIKAIMTDPKFMKLLNLPPDIVGQTFYSNSSYDGYMENTTLCPRSMGAEALLNAIGDQLGRPLTVSEQIYVSQEMQNLSKSPECVYCYVATDRKADREFMGRYIDERDAILKKYSSGDTDTSRGGKLYEEFRNGRKDTNSRRRKGGGKILGMWDRFQMFVEAKNSGNMITKSDVANLDTIAQVLSDESTPKWKKEQLQDVLDYAAAAAWAKKRKGYAAYGGEILKWTKSRIDKLNSHYGLRMYSFSDFSPAFILENMQMIQDASVRGLKMLAYTKDINFVKIFAPTGMNINVSVYGMQVGDQILENNIIGTPWSDAQQMREKYGNVGITFVATNDTLVEWALAQDWIDVVIPFHLVRTGKEVAKQFGFTDYTSESSDKKITGMWNKGKDMASIPPTVHNNDLETYLKAAEENHLKPRFDRFLDNPNYMKLVNECRKSASESNPVQPLFNYEPAEAALHDMMRDGGYFQPIGGSMEATYEIAERIAGDIEGKARYSVAGTENLIRDAVSKKITAGMSDSERTEILLNKTVSAPEYNEQADSFIKNEKAGLGSREIRLVKKALVRIGKEFGAFREYKNTDMQLEVLFSVGNIKESTKKAVTDSNQLAKLLPVLDKSIESAVGIETHDNRYFADDNALFFHELLGGYVESGSFVPVRYGIKELKDGTCTLYVVVCQEKIKTEVLKSEHMENSSGHPDSRSVTITVADIAKNVNTPDLLRYLPDGMLNEQQISVKYEELAKTILYTNDKNDRAYKEAIKRADVAMAKKMVDRAAKNAGYRIVLHHGTAGDPFYVFTQGAEGIHFGTLEQAEKRASITEGRYGYKRNWYTVEDIRNNPSVFSNEARKEILESILESSANLTAKEEQRVEELAFDEGTISINEFLYFVEKSEKTGGATAFNVRNKDVGKDASRRIISAYIMANNTVEFDTDIGEWTTYNISDVLLAKIRGETIENYDPKISKWINYNPSGINGIQLTEADVPALERLSQSREFSDIAEFLRSKGIDSIRYPNRYEGTMNEYSYILLSPDQIKSADYVTYDDSGNVIPISQRFNQYKQDFRYSISGTENLISDALKAANEKYGSIKRGENPAREMDIPVQFDDDKKVSLTIRTALEAGVTPDLLVPKLTKELVNGKFSHDVRSNKETLRRARETISGYTRTEDALAEWNRNVGNGDYLSVDAEAQGYVLYNQLATLATEASDIKDQERYAKQAIAVLTDIVNMTREAARMVQATRILKRMAPESKLFSLERAVDNLNKKIQEATSDIKLEKGRERLEIDQDLAANWLTLLHKGNKTEAAKVEEQLYKSIASQVKRTFKDRWDAWRYLSMLGNFKTLARNYIGNQAMVPVKFTKDKIAAAIESVFVKNQSNRTKYLGSTHTKTGQEIRNFAMDDYRNVQNLIRSSDKYSDFSNTRLMAAIREYKSKFQLPGLKHWQAAVDWAMNGDLIGDSHFMKKHYTNSFAQIALARGWTAENIKSGRISQAQLDGARSMAFNEAQKATFRDINAFSGAIRKIRFKGNSRAAKIGNIFVEGILPFRGTPANVLVRAVEYSPLELLYNATVGTWDVAHGKITAGEYIDRWASGLTGSSIWALGMLLAGLGLVTGGEDDDDEKRMGYQGYSLNVGGKSISLDWLSPVAIPFFMGVESFNFVAEPLINNEPMNLGAVLTAISTSFQPMLEMSCLSSINSLLDTMSYAGDADAGQLIYSFFVSPFISYVGQAVPTILSQTSNTIEKIGEKTFVSDIDDQFTRNITYDLVKLAEKLPPLSWRQVPRVDAWGRVEEKETALDYVYSGLESFLSPAYINDIQVNEADLEIERLQGVFQKQIDALNLKMSKAKTYEQKQAIKKEISSIETLMNISPDVASTKIGNVRLTQQQYTTYALEKGKQNYELATAMMETSWYDGLSDVRKSEAIQQVFDLADARGRYAAVGTIKTGYNEIFITSDTETAIQTVQEKMNSKWASAAKKESHATLREIISKNGDAAKVFKELRNLGYSNQQIQQYSREEISSLYKDGSISDTTAVNYLKKYGGLSSSDAVDRATYWKWQKNNPDSVFADGQHEDAALKYERSLKTYGISSSVWETIYKSRQTDKKPKQDVLNDIHKQALTVQQKDALYYACGYAASGLSDTPWH